MQVDGATIVCNRIELFDTGTPAASFVPNSAVQIGGLVGLNHSTLLISHVSIVNTQLLWSSVGFNVNWINGVSALLACTGAMLMTPRLCAASA
jgi:hypothetical protein